MCALPFVFLSARDTLLNIVREWEALIHVIRIVSDGVRSSTE
jgi:hypothetical protein